MQPTKQDAITFLNQVIELAKVPIHYEFLEHWRERDTDTANDQVAWYYCLYCNITIEKLLAIEEMVQIETALELNEIAKRDGGHVQAWLNNFSYLRGYVEEKGFW